MKTVVLSILGLIAGFFVGEALAVLVGTAADQLSDAAPPGLWILRSLPFVFAVAGAITVPVLFIRRRSR